MRGKKSAPPPPTPRGLKEDGWADDSCPSKLMSTTSAGIAFIRVVIPMKYTKQEGQRSKALKQHTFPRPCKPLAQSSCNNALRVTALGLRSYIYYQFSHMPIRTLIVDDERN